MYYKLGQDFDTNWGSFVLLQIVANILTNWGRPPMNSWGKCYQNLGKLLRFRAIFVSKWGSYNKLEKIYYKFLQILQFRVFITNLGITGSAANLVHLYTHAIKPLSIKSKIKKFNPFMHNVVKWPNIP